MRGGVLLIPKQLTGEGVKVGALCKCRMHPAIKDGLCKKVMLIVICSFSNVCVWGWGWGGGRQCACLGLFKVIRFGCNCVASIGLVIRESVDSLCRDGADTPIVRLHWKAFLTREYSRFKPFSAREWPIQPLLYPMIPHK